jgi:ribosomal protein S18 acetylase RimI-like enzyme
VTSPRFLIDTNVFIGLEDSHRVPADFASFEQLARKHGISVKVHEAAKDDIERDGDSTRRAISLSKLDKFPLIPKRRGVSKGDLEAEFGSLPRPNDVVDAWLLHALQINLVDFLVTEDAGLHRRAERHSTELGGRVLYVADAHNLLRTTFEPFDVPLRYVQELDAHEIPPGDPIFESLREGYGDFDRWWQEKCVEKQRRCWVVLEDDQIAGLIVRKEEAPADTDARSTGTKILKICTFKVRPESRGQKIGELLLKKALWFAVSNSFDVLYLTTYDTQDSLIDLLTYYGFDNTYVTSGGELVLEKVLPRMPVDCEIEDLYGCARINYPILPIIEQIPSCVIPIREQYHDKLFPDLRDDPQSNLFDSVVSLDTRKPGNTIRKVYLCRTPMKHIDRGSILLFYKSRSELLPSQSITAVGVFEDLALAHSTEELRRLAGGRSVYSERELVAFGATQDDPVKVINFLLSGYLDPSFSLAELMQHHILRAPPQSFQRIATPTIRPLIERLGLGFAFP